VWGHNGISGGQVARVIGVRGKESPETLAFGFAIPRSPKSDKIRDH
jgi:hypothetical protein